MEVKFGMDLNYFLWSLLGGSILAFVYDMLRAMRKISVRSVLCINIEDIMFFLFAGAMTFFIAYTKNDGRLRWHGFLGTAGGFFVCRILFGNIVISILTRIYGILAKTAALLTKVVMLPVQLLCRLLAKPISVVSWYSREKIRSAERIVKVKVRRRSVEKNIKIKERNRKRQLLNNNGTSRKNFVDKG